MRTTTPLIVSLRISGSGRTTSYSIQAAAYLTEVGAIVTVTAVINILHTTVIGGVVLVRVTWDIMKNVLQRRTATKMKFAYG